MVSRPESEWHAGQIEGKITAPAQCIGSIVPHYNESGTAEVRPVFRPPADGAQ